MDPALSGLTGILAILLFTSFVKIFTALNIMRFGLGLEGGSIGLVVFAIAFSISLYVTSPQLDKAGGFDTVFSANSFDKLIPIYTPFLEKQVDPELLKRFTERRQPEAGKVLPAASQISSLSLAFLVGELNQAFKIGLMVLIPFLVIDLLVASVLMILGVTQISAAVIALPCKLLLFFAVDGWTLVTEKLIASYL